jgi:hypothetical protein
MKLKNILLIFIGCSIISIATSQNNMIENRLNTKLGLSFYPPLSITDNRTANYRMEVNYGFLKYFEAGAYLGYSRVKTIEPAINSVRNVRYTHSPFYGITANFHILPFFLKKNNFRFDYYLTGKVGGNYYFTTEGAFPEHGHHSEYALGMGLAFYTWKHLGLFTEYCYGKYSYYGYPPGTYMDNLQSNLRFGITYKFKKNTEN